MTNDTCRFSLYLLDDEIDGMLSFYSEDCTNVNSSVSIKMIVILFLKIVSGTDI